MKPSILFVTSHSYLPQKIGGAEASTHQLCIEMLKNGYPVSVLSTLDSGDFISFKTRLKMKLHRTDTVCDYVMKYPVFRVWDLHEKLPKVINSLKPDWVIMQAGECIKLAKIALQTNGTHKVSIYVRDVEFAKHGGEYFADEKLSYIANSDFTSQKLLKCFQLKSTAIPPMVDYSKYKVPLTGTQIVFICPFPEKGVHLATEIAKNNPHLPFLFVESWSYTDEVKRYLVENVEPLKNVKLTPKQLDMVNIYSQAKIVIMPSLWEEAWGRVASEAQVSGIPVIARAIGGLKESVGKGGILMAPDATAFDWSEKINKLFSEPSYYREISQNALEYSQREVISVDHLTRQFIKLIEQE
ncbi:glycosyltransferase [Aliiglaciecola sp. SL4]|uniref:glycosyltransferase n=1 Tax=Aliiglaciecola sp. SL4 TaxID=3239806 RepID=UPI00355BABEE